MGVGLRVNSPELTFQTLFVATQFAITPTEIGCGGSKLGHVFVGIPIELGPAHFAAEFYFLALIDDRVFLIIFVQQFIGNEAGVFRIRLRIAGGRSGGACAARQRENRADGEQIKDDGFHEWLVSGIGKEFLRPIYDLGESK